MSNRKIVVAGGTGFIGERLVASLVVAGEVVVVLTRVGRAVPKGARAVKWDGERVGDWASELDGAFAVINLAGEPIAQRWSPEAKRRIRDSRVKSVEAICSAIQGVARPPDRWINASAIGFYGDRGDEIVDERSPAGDGFVAETCVAWERAVFGCSKPGVRRTAVRIGVVLGWAGALAPLAKLARWRLGGTVGPGDQGVSWIHVDDLVGIFEWLLDLANPPQIVNGTSPDWVPNREFMAAIRQVLGVSTGVPLPAFLARIVGKAIGPDADLLLSGVRARPAAILATGYEFRFLDLEDALTQILAK